MDHSKANGEEAEPARLGRPRRIVFPKRGKWEYLSDDLLTVSTFGIPPVFRRAFFEILHTTGALYRRLFGPRWVGWVEFNASKVDSADVRLWTNGSDRVYLTLRDERQFLPAPQSGVFHVHGLAHELAHILLYRSLVNIAALAEGWGEGWAIYLSSFIAVPYLYRKYGAAMWPYPYNYLETEGPTRYLRMFADEKRRRADPTMSAVWACYMLEERLGRGGFAKFFRNVLRTPLHAGEFADLVLRQLPRKTGTSR